VSVPFARNPKIIIPDPIQTGKHHRIFPAGVVIQSTLFGFDILPSSALMAAIEEALEPGDETLLQTLVYTIW
jgi:hypothetical protein